MPGPSQADTWTLLLLRSQQGDARAYSELYIALRPRVRDFIASRDGQLTAEEREDVVQDVFLGVWQALGNYRGDCSAQTYLFAVAKNTLRERLRRKSGKRAATIPIPHPDLLPDKDDGGGDEARAEFVAALKETLASLPPDQQKAFQLTVIERMPVAEAASQLGCTAGTIYKRLKKAGMTLMKAIKRASP